MLRSLFVKLSFAAAVLSLATAQMARAENVDGVITRVELRESPRHIMVRTATGEVQVRIANRTNVDFGAVDQGYFSNELSSLKAGMEVQVSANGDEPASRIHVTSVPPEQRRQAILELERTGQMPGVPSAAVPAAPAAGLGEMKVRLNDVNRGRGTFKADVAGHERSFRTEDPKMLARFEEGDLVIVRMREGSPDIVSDIRSSELNGRIVDIDHTAGTVRVDVGGRVEAYKIDRIKGLRLREGDRVRFQSEERETGDKVIVRINRD